MNALLRVGACAVILVSAVLFVGCVLVPWLGGPSLVPADLNEICQQLLEESNRSDELNDRVRVVRVVIDGKLEVTQDAIADRTSLVEAASRFRSLRDQAKDFGIDVGTHSDAELAREVITWVSVVLQNDPARDEVLHRLEEEFQQAYPHEKAGVRGKTAE